MCAMLPASRECPVANWRGGGVTVWRDLVSITDITFRRGGLAPEDCGTGHDMDLSPDALTKVAVPKEPLLG